MFRSDRALFEEVDDFDDTGFLEEGSGLDAVGACEGEVRISSH